MYYETHITYNKPLSHIRNLLPNLKSTKQQIISVKIIKTESMTENNKGVYCVLKDYNFETIGFISTTRKAAYDIALKHCVLPEENSRLIYDFKAMDDRKEILETVSKDFPELLI